MMGKRKNCTAFAKGDFSTLALSFQQAGFLVQQPLAGVIQIGAMEATLLPQRLRLLISVGLHGDETAPIEMMALLLEELSKTPLSLAVDLMLVVGNLPAIAQAKRFVDVDLNRLFTPPCVQHTQINPAQEAKRADQLMAVAEQFFKGHRHKWHLDLHTAIRASLYPTFAIVPGNADQPAFLHWLRKAGIAAIVLNPHSSVTFSAYTCTHLGAVSCTAELGRVGKWGKNELSQLLPTQQAIHTLLRFGLDSQQQGSEFNLNHDPLIFRIEQELIKRSEAFQFTFDDSTPNFTEFASHSVIATDGERTYKVGGKPEYVLFPNASVQVGLRAGLMATRLLESD